MCRTPFCRSHEAAGYALTPREVLRVRGCRGAPTLLDLQHDKTTRVPTRSHISCLQESRGRWLCLDAARAIARARLPGSTDASLLEFSLRTVAFRTWADVAVFS